jgi:hypothetical protein
MSKPSPMQIVKQLTGHKTPVDAKKAFAKSLVGKKVGDQETLQTLSNTQLLRLARRHAPDLLGAFAPAKKEAKK